MNHRDDDTIALPGTGGWAVRPTREPDREPFGRLLSSVGLPESGFTDQFEHFVVAERDGHIVGGAGVERYGRDGLLRSVVVDASQQRSGLGSRLVAECVTRAESDGLGALYLLTETAPEFFAALGFVRIDRASVPEAIARSSEFASVCPDSAVAMMLPLVTGSTAPDRAP